MSTAVLIAVGGAREAAIAAACTEAPDLLLERRCADLGEAVAVAQAGVGAVVVVSWSPSLTRDVVGTFTEAGLAVVGVADDAESAARMTAMGIVELLEPAAPAREVVGLIERALRAGSRSVVARKVRIEKPATGTIVAVWGPTGAPGRTTVAAGLAYELASIGPTVVVDVDTYGPGLGLALGLDGESAGIAAVARAGLTGSLADDVMERQLISVSPGLRVLSGLSRPERWPELGAAALEPVWQALRSRATFVVLDCGFCLERDEELQYDTRAPLRNGATLAAIDAADVVVAVGSCEPIGLQRLIHGLSQLDEIAPQLRTPRIVAVNKLRYTAAGVRPRQAVADALREYANVQEAWTLPWDPHACDAAALAGQAVGERAPRSALAKAMKSMAGAVAELRRGRHDAPIGARRDARNGLASATLEA